MAAIKVRVLHVWTRHFQQDAGHLPLLLEQAQGGRQQPLWCVGRLSVSTFLLTILTPQRGGVQRCPQTVTGSLWPFRDTISRLVIFRLLSGKRLPAHETLSMGESVSHKWGKLQPTFQALQTRKVNYCSPESHFLSRQITPAKIFKMHHVPKILQMVRD